jgi:hypothetical protein
VFLKTNTFSLVQNMCNLRGAVCQSVSVLTVAARSDGGGGGGVHLLSGKRGIPERAAVRG